VLRDTNALINFNVLPRQHKTHCYLNQPRRLKVKIIEMNCFCGMPYQARVADIKRGWGKTCSKRCAAIKREFGRPNGKPADPSIKIHWGKKPNRKIENQLNTELRAEEKAKREGYYPFSSEREMFEAMCDNPVEGR
jgi:hypothetical protein